jgi:hypothetical protein
VGNQCPLVGSPFAHPSDGGLRVSGAGTLVANCTFIANAAEVGGGAGVLGGAALVNCTFSGNHAVYIAGAYVATGAALISCTFTQNVADDEHGGVSASDANVHNCIFWGNAPDQFNGTAATMLTHSDIQGGWSGRGWNNIDADPLFVDSDGLDGQPGTADDDLRLEAGSPCVDAGINSGMPTDAADLDGDGEMSELTPYDLDSNPRFADGPPKDTGCGVPVVVDMGAYEFQGKPFDVRLGDIDGNGNVGFTDFLALLDAWGACAEDCCLPDLDLDSEVGVTDFLLLLGNWG